MSNVTLTREAAQQALDALDKMIDVSRILQRKYMDYGGSFPSEGVSCSERVADKLRKSIATLQATIDAPDVEPVGLLEIMYRHKDGNIWFRQYSKDAIPEWAVDIRPFKQAASTKNTP